MSDITKCATLGCPSEEVCWRKKAPEDPPYQSYALFRVPRGASSCEYFWPFSSQDRVEETQRAERLNRHRDDVISTADQAVS